MSPKPIGARDLMYHLVIVRPEPAGQFTAQPLGVPEIRVVSGSPEWNCRLRRVPRYT